MGRRTFGVSLFCRQQKIKKDGKAPVEVTITVNGAKASFQLDKYYVPAEFVRLRDSNRTNEVKKLCSQVTTAISEIRERHPESEAGDLKRYYLEGDPLVTRIGRITVRKLCEIYLNEVAKGLPTYDKYRVTFDRLTKRFGYRSADDVTGGDMKAFINDLRDKEHFAPGTCRNYYKRCKSAWDYGWRLGICHTTPFVNLRMTFIDPDPVFLSPEEYEAFKALNPKQEYLKRTQEAWLFMAGCGVEYKDLQNLEPEDVQDRNGVFYLTKARAKTGVVFKTVLCDEAPRIWKKWMEEGKIWCPANQPFNRWLKALAKEANIRTNLTTLTARHQFASMLLGGYWGDRVPAEVIMVALGHTGLQQSLRYAQLTEESQLSAFAGIKK